MCTNRRKWVYLVLTEHLSNAQVEKGKRKMIEQLPIWGTSVANEKKRDCIKDIAFWNENPILGQPCDQMHRYEHGYESSHSPLSIEAHLGKKTGRVESPSPWKP